jgi:hypothetical protein
MEERVKRPPNSFLAVIFVLGFSALGFSSATNVYITPNGQATGVCTTNPQTPAWFNSAANWGSGASQIGPGTTVTICGTITTALTFQGSGTSNSPLTLLFSSGAVVSLPNCGNGSTSACISGNGNSFLIIDGGSNGVLQETSNGTGLATRNNNFGIYLPSCNTCIVRNLTIANTYVHTVDPSDTTVDLQGGIYMDACSSCTVTNNVIHDARYCVFFGYPNGATTSNFTDSFNTFSNCEAGTSLGDDSNNNNSTTMNGVSFHDNTYTNSYLWDTTSDAYHHDMWHSWSTQSNALVTNLSIYNNYAFGNLGANLNGCVYTENQQSNLQIYNNICITTNATGPGSGCWGAGPTMNHYQLYNNTCVIPSNTNYAFWLTGGSTILVQNNIFECNAAQCMQVNSGVTGLTLNYNDWHSTNTGNGFSYLGKSYGTFAQYQSGSGQDPNGLGSSPNLTPDGHESANSPTIQYSNNLTSLGVPPLDSDRSGQQRPAGSCTKQQDSPCWDTGAYQYGTSPAPPTGLTAVVN